MNYTYNNPSQSLWSRIQISKNASYSSKSIDLLKPCQFSTKSIIRTVHIKSSAIEVKTQKRHIHVIRINEVILCYSWSEGRCKWLHIQRAALEGSQGSSAIVLRYDFSFLHKMRLPSCFVVAYWTYWWIDRRHWIHSCNFFGLRYFHRYVILIFMHKQFVCMLFSI